MVRFVFYPSPEQFETTLGDQITLLLVAIVFFFFFFLIAFNFEKGLFFLIFFVVNFFGFIKMSFFLNVKFAILY